MNRKQVVWIIIIALVVGGIGGVLLNRFGIPYISTLPGFSWARNLESSNPVVINHREEVQFSEGVDLVNLSKQLSNYSAGIYSVNNGSYKFLENGIVVSSDGMILTSKTPLPSSGNLVAVLNDGKNYPAQVRALDPRSEIAVLTVPASNLAFASFGDTSALAASERVMYVGRSNADFGHTIKMGLVTQALANEKSLDRVFYSEAFEYSVQTDAAVNSDFVGGFVSNLEGQIVGMVTANLSVLPAEDLQTAVAAYLSTGKIQRPSFGVKYLNLSSQLATLKGLPQGGVLVVSVDDNSPAKKAELQPGDFIIKVDSQDLSSTEFEKILNSHSISGMPITVLRGGNQIQLTVKLEAK